jgi:hypothetical protein
MRLVELVLTDEKPEVIESPPQAVVDVRIFLRVLP